MAWPLSEFLGDAFLGSTSCGVVRLIARTRRLGENTKIFLRQNGGGLSVNHIQRPLMFAILPEQRWRGQKRLTDQCQRKTFEWHGPSLTVASICQRRGACNGGQFREIPNFSEPARAKENYNISEGRCRGRRRAEWSALRVKAWITLLPCQPRPRDHAQPADTSTIRNATSQAYGGCRPIAEAGINVFQTPTSAQTTSASRGAMTNRAT